MRCAWILVLPFLLPGSASAQCASWAEGFGAEIPNGTVRASAVFDDGSGERVVHGGDFTSVGTRPLSFVGAWDGTEWSELGGGLDGPVGALHVHDFGQGPRLVAGGGFLTAGTTPASHVAVWDGSSWSALGAGFDADVLALETYDDGTGPALYAGGVFTHSGATSVSRIARWNGTSWAPLGPGVNSVVRALEVWGSTLYVGGEFFFAGALPAGRIARWNGSAWSALGVGVDAAVNALAFHAPSTPGDTGLYVGGDFTGAGGQTAAGLARWSGSGWTAVGSFNGPVRALRVHDEGAGPRLFVGGSFTAIGSQRLVRYDGVNGFSSLGNGPGLAQVLAIASQGSGAGSRIFAGGLRQLAPGPSALHWDSNGWNVTAGPRGLMRLQGPGRVTRLASARVAGRTDLYVQGDFVQAGDAPGRHLARWNGSEWSSIGALPAFSPNAALAEFDDGTGPALYLTSAFTTVGGTAANHIARWNGTSWSPLGAGLDGYGAALAVHDDGTGPALFVAGAFTAAGGQPASRIARWNGTSWSALGTGLDSTAYALASYDDGTGSKLHVAGGFVLAGGQVVRRIASWDGSSWTTLAGGMDGVVWSLAVYDDGTGSKLYAGGDFTTAGPLSASRIASWNGTTWSTLGAGTNQSVFALAAHDDGAGRVLYAGGAFAVAGGLATGTLARWNGSVWTAASSTLSDVGGGVPFVSALHAWDDGGGDGPALFVGGSFTAAGGIPSHGIAELRGCRIASFCAGDGLDAQVTTSCPCANFGASGNGCAWHAGPAGAALAASGRIAPGDELVLTASGMPASAPSTIFLKGDALIAEGVVFGDGVRCAGGDLIRLGTKVNAGGVAHYPEAGNAPISVRGGTPAGSGAIGYYQTYYRNAASFCTSATFNVTNGVQVVW